MVPVKCGICGRCTCGCDDCKKMREQPIPICASCYEAVQREHRGFNPPLRDKKEREFRKEVQTLMRSHGHDKDAF